MPVRPLRPTCRHCRKPLRRYRWRTHEWAIRLRLEWGDYGEGLFCSLRCGYRYAVTSLGGKPGV